MSADRVFVDTNVLLYAFDRSAGAKRQRAADLLARVWQSGDGCVSVQVLQEFYVNSTRKITNPLDAKGRARSGLLKAYHPSAWAAHSLLLGQARGIACKWVG